MRDMVSWSLPRTCRAELMDDPALPEADHLQALDALATINAVSRTAAAMAAEIAVIAPRGPLEVADLACGGGDVTVGVARQLRRRGIEARVVGYDLSPRAVLRAREASHGEPAVSFSTRDLAAEGCPPCDVAISSLFFHHLDDAAVTSLLASVARTARAGLVASDLLRSRGGLLLAWLGTHLLARSSVARVDGPRSVHAARTLPEYRQLCRDAGLHAATVRPVWPARAIIRWTCRPGEGER